MDNFTQAETGSPNAVPTQQPYQLVTTCNVESCLKSAQQQSPPASAKQYTATKEVKRSWRCFQTMLSDIYNIVYRYLLIG